MSNNNTYNGWRNFETWKVKLELLDNYQAREDQTVAELAEEMKQFCEEIIDCETSQGFAYDCAMQMLNRVDWEEIAEHILE